MNFCTYVCLYRCVCDASHSHRCRRSHLRKQRPDRVQCPTRAALLLCRTQNRYVHTILLHYIMKTRLSIIRKCNYTVCLLDVKKPRCEMKSLHEVSGNFPTSKSRNKHFSFFSLRLALAFCRAAFCFLIKRFSL